jgi:hypothetical protein
VSHGLDRYVNVYDWSTWRGNLVRAPFDGEQVGDALAREVAKSLQSQLFTNNDRKIAGSLNIHVIGVSVGTFS